MGSSLQLSLIVFVLLHTTLLIPDPVTCKDVKDNLLQGLNSYRNSLGLPALAKNDKASCLADEVAEELEDKPCISNMGPITTTTPGSQPQIPNYPDLLKKCDIDPNTTRDGVILPVCVPNKVETLMLTNYTHTQYSRYLNNSKYTGAGLGSEDDWMVLVLATTTPSAGSFASTATATAATFVSRVGMLEKIEDIVSKSILGLLSLYIVSLYLGSFLVFRICD